MEVNELLLYCQKYFEYSVELKGLVQKVVRQGSPIRVGSRPGTLHPSGHRIIKIVGKQYKESHLVYLIHTGKLPDEELDHKNRNTTDNSFENLRPCSRSENCRNREGWGKDSKYKGVYPNKRGSRWDAQITINKKSKYLGSFMTEDEAAKAYDIAAIANDQNFSKTNFPKEIYNVPN